MDSAAIAIRPLTSKVIVKDRGSQKCSKSSKASISNCHPSRAPRKVFGPGHADPAHSAKAIQARTKASFRRKLSGLTISGFGIFNDALDMIIPTGMPSSTDSAMKITSGMVQPTNVEGYTCDPANKSASFFAARLAIPILLIAVSLCKTGWSPFTADFRKPF